MNQTTHLRISCLLFLLLALGWGSYQLFGTASAKQLQVGTQSILAGQAAGPTLSVTGGLSVQAGQSINIPIAFVGNGAHIAAIGLSLDFDQACLAFDNSDSNGDSVPDAITFDLSPQFFPSAAYDAQDSDGEIDLIIADYSPPLAKISDSVQLISVRFTAICQPPSAAGLVSPINFSAHPIARYSDQNGQDVDGSAISNSVLILPNASFTPQPTPTATGTAPPTPTATTTPVPVAGNRSPLAGNDSVVTNEDTAIQIDVLQNDSDPDGDSLIVDLPVQPQHGTITRNPDHTITYLPASNYFGTDSFSYIVSDGRGGALTALVNITVRAVNDPPVILIAPSNQVNQVGETVTLILSASDPDTAQDALRYSSKNLPSGIVISSQSGVISGTLNHAAMGDYSVILTVSDGSLSDSVQFQWSVTGETAAANLVYLPLVNRE